MKKTLVLDRARIYRICQDKNCGKQGGKTKAVSTYPDSICHSLVLRDFSELFGINDVNDTHLSPFDEELYIKLYLFLYK